MATLTATQNGDWSDPLVWGGSTPADGDTVDASTYSILFDVDVTQPNTLLTATTGYFYYSGAGTRTVEARADAGTHSSAGLIHNTGTGTLTFDGPITGGAGYNAIGAQNTGTGTLNVTTATGGAGGGANGAQNTGTGTLNVTTATGGAGNSANGAHNSAAGTLSVTTATGGAGSSANGAQNTGTGTLNVTTATGGAGSNARGAQNTGTGTLNVTTATGGAGGGAHGAQNTGTGTLHCDLAIGSNWGVDGSGSYTHGVHGSGAAGQTTTVKRIQSGPYGCVAIGGAVFIEPDATNSAQFRTGPNGATLTLVDSGAGADFPAESDVRHGVQYDVGSKTGTAYIPAAGQVALGIPVDNTVGTAVLTAAAAAAAVWDAARSAHSNAGSFGAVDEWAGSVDMTAIETAISEVLAEVTRCCAIDIPERPYQDPIVICGGEPC